MKKFFSIILLISVCIMQGCSVKELNEKMVIQGLGIDYAQNEYKVTAMYINTSDETGEKSYKTETGKGRTITEAVVNIVSQNGLEPLYSHNSFIILGRSICQSGVSEAMEFFAGYYQCRPSVNVLVTDTDAQKVMNLEYISPEIITRISENESTIGVNLTTPMYVFWADILNASTSACTSLITVDENNILKSKGIAVFKDDKIENTLNSSQTMGVMLIRGESNISAEAIPIDGKSKSFSLSSHNTKTTVRVENGTLYCDIKIKGEVNIYEYVESKENLEEEIEKSINKIAESAIKECIKNGNDIFYFGKRLKQSDKKIYLSVKNWKKFIQNGVYSVSSDISIR